MPIAVVMIGLALLAGHLAFLSTCGEDKTHEPEKIKFWDGTVQLVKWSQSRMTTTRNLLICVDGPNQWRLEQTMSNNLFQTTHIRFVSSFHRTALFTNSSQQEALNVYINEI
jgi:hypothetical protein